MINFRIIINLFFIFGFSLICNPIYAVNQVDDLLYLRGRTFTGMDYKVGQGNWNKMLLGDANLTVYFEKVPDLIRNEFDTAIFVKNSQEISAAISGLLFGWNVTTYLIKPEYRLNWVVPLGGLVLMYGLSILTDHLLYTVIDERNNWFLERNNVFLEIEPTTTKLGLRII